MKKITLLLVFFLAVFSAGYGQCLVATSSTPLYPSATYTPAVCDGTTLNSITTAGYASEYSNVNVTSGETYTFTSSIATDFITIGSQDGTTAITFGEGGSLTWVADIAGVVRFYTHLDANCGAANVNRVRGVICGTPPTCMKPTNVLVSNLTTTGADFSWSAGGTETAWEILILPNADPAPDNATAGTPLGASTYTETSLTESTAYKFYVRASCGGGDFSLWTSGSAFVTACAPVSILPWTEGFEDIATVGTTAFPPCWFEQNGDWASAAAATYNTPRTGTKYIRDAWSATNEFMWSPGFQLAAGVNYDFSFYAQGDGYSGWAIDVFSNNMQDSATATQIGATYTPAGGSSASIQPYNKVVNTFTPATDGVYYFAIRVNQASSAPWYLAFDDFKLELTPACAEPAALVASNVTSAGASVSWTASVTSPANGYEYYISEDPTNPDAATVPTGTVAAGVLIYDFTGLTASTTYNVWVRSACGAGATSEWSAKVMFTTFCLPVNIPWMEDFETVAVGTNVFPSCWAYANTSSVWNIETFPTAYSGINSLGRTWNTNGWAYTPTVSLNAGTSYNFSYYVRTNDEIVGYDVTVAAGAGQTEADMTETLNAVTGYHNANWEKKAFNFIPSTTGVYSFGIHVVAPYAPNGINFDDFKIDLTPSCVEPTLLVVSNITDATATVSWTESITVPSNGYEYYISTDVTNPDVATVPTGSVAAGVLTYAFTGLTANTTYYVWVRSVCGASETSEWSSKVMFKTLCTTATDLFENFDASTNIPDCWSKVGAGGTISVSSFNTAFSAPNNMSLNSNSATNLATIALPPLSNTAAGTHQLKFKARSQYTFSVGGMIEVGYLTDINDAASFVMLESFTTTSGTVYDSFTANLGTQPQSMILAMRNPGTPTSGVVIDDVSWAPIPSTAPVCAVSSATPDAACGNSATVLSWDAVAGVDGYNLSIGTAAGLNDIMNNQPIGDVTTYNYIGNFNTTYYFTVTPFNGFGLATGCVEQSFSTFVDGCYCVSNPTSNDGIGITNVQLETTDFPNGDVVYADYTSTTVNLSQGASTNLQVSFGTGFTYDTNIWIDFNNDLTFDAGEIVNSGNSLATNPTVLDLTFNMPVDAALGVHRMRLGAADFGQANPNPCFSGSYGVTIDFSVNIDIQNSTSSFNDKNFTYYPNPVKDVLNLSYTKNISNVTVFNLLGQQIATKGVNANQSQIDMSNLAAGTYLVKVTADNQVKTIKVIKK